MQQSKVSVKYSEENFVSGESFISTYSIFGGEGGREGEGGWGEHWRLHLFKFEWEGEGVGRLFEAGRLLTFLPLGWALIRGGC